MKLLCINYKVLYRIFPKFNMGHLKALLIAYFKNMLLQKKIYVRENQASLINSTINEDIIRKTYVYRLQRLRLKLY